jgi:crossover junction endodeoxyribonuclease RuvC
VKTPVRILGIDPGSQITGYGCVEVTGQLTRPIRWGSIRTEGDHFDRLRRIYSDLQEIVAGLKPDEIAIERVFIHRNADSALKLGQARAAALAATFAIDLPIYEYAARQIKKSLVGNGGAEKSQVQRMVGLVLGIRDGLQADAADALATAVCHAHTRGTRNWLREASS